MEAVDAVGQRLRRILADAVGACRAEGILLSGGLDTSVLAHLSAEAGKRLRAVTVSLNPDEIDEAWLGGAALSLPAEKGEVLDLGYAEALASSLGLEHHLVMVSIPELMAAAESTVDLLGTFDPMEVRNSAVILLGLREVQRLGIDGVMTGDGADELLAGYSYIFNKPEAEIESYTRSLDTFMHFTSLDLGKALGVEVFAPYLDPSFRRFAVDLPASVKVGTRQGRRMGKWVLRKAFEGELAERILWRTKTPIEYGSGSTVLGSIMSARMDALEFDIRRGWVKTEDRIEVDTPEKLWLYERYRRTFGPPAQLSGAGKRCPQCRGPLPRAEATYCPICGAWPI